MRILIRYVVQEEARHRYDSEIVDFSLIPPLYSPEPHRTDIEREIVKWLKQKQLGLSNNEKIVVIKTLEA